MPSKLKKPCRHSGCRNTTRERFCGQHQREAYRRPSDRYRGTSAERGYDHDWRCVRDEHLAEHPLCEDCLANGVVNDEHLEVDHIIPIRVRPELRLVRSNLRTLCRRHHQLKTQREDRAYDPAGKPPRRK